MAQRPVNHLPGGNNMSRSERLYKAHMDLEARLGRIPLDKNGRTLRDDDDVFISEQLLASVDPPIDDDIRRFYPPGQYPRLGVVVPNKAKAEKESLKTLFSAWVKLSPDFDQDQQWSNLLLMFRYALKRPLMPQSDLFDALRGLGLDRAFTNLFGGEEKPNAKSSLHEQLNYICSQYAKGQITDQSAELQYRNLLNVPNVSKINLGWRLETYGIPREHVIGAERKAFMATFATSPEESKLKYRLTSLIGIYRSGQLSFDEAMMCVSEELGNVVVDPSLVSTLLFAENIKPAEVAEGILDCAEDTPLGRPSADELGSQLDELAEDFISQYAEGIANGLKPSIALAEYRDKHGLKNMSSSQENYILAPFSDLETNTPDTDEQQISTPDNFDFAFLLEVAENFQTRYIEDIIGGLDPGVALTEFRQDIGIKDFSPPEVAFIFEQLQLPQGNIAAVNDVEVNQVTPKSMLEEDAPATESALNQRGGTPGTKSGSISRDKPLSASSNSVTILGDMPDHQDPSQEEGFTADLFGLEMPIEIAKKLGFSIGLSDDHVRRRIRSSTPHRTTLRRSPSLSKTAMEPPKRLEKRKASPEIQRGRRMSPLKTDRDDETSKEAVVESVPDEHGASVVDWLEGVPDDQTSMKDIISNTLEKLQTRYHIIIERADFSRFMNDNNQETDFKGNPLTITEHLDKRVMHKNGVFSTDNENIGVHLGALTWKMAAAQQKAEIATKIKSGEILPIENNKHEELIALLYVIELHPTMANVRQLMEAINQAVLPSNQSPSPVTHKTTVNLEEQTRDVGKLPPLQWSSSYSINQRRPTKPHKKVGGTHVDTEPSQDMARMVADSAYENGRSYFVHLAILRNIRPKANVSMDDDRYFQNSTSTMASSQTSPTSNLNKLFEKYKEKSDPDPDTVGIEGSMRYLEDLGVKLDEVVLLAVLTELSAPTMGELSRSGFVDGWKSRDANDISAQKAIVREFRKQLPQPDFFRRMYKHTFKLALATGQKSLPLEVAMEYWRLLLQAPSLSWYSAPTSTMPQPSPWLDWWLDYLETRWKKGVSKDMWEQTGKFVLKTLEPNGEDMSWWSEDSAWPGVIDQFVEYVKEKREGQMEG